MIGKLYATVIDSPDPARAAAFYGAILGMPVEYEEQHQQEQESG
jgi:catechol 2,3-dioxygenase-like lactoylglutathione lyase family enzyme